MNGPSVSPPVPHRIRDRGLASLQLATPIDGIGTPDPSPRNLINVCVLSYSLVNITFV